MMKIWQENDGHECILVHSQPYDHKVGQRAIYHCEHCRFKFAREYDELHHVIKWLVIPFTEDGVI